MAWDTHARRRIDLVGRKDDGDKVIAHEFDFSIENQVGLWPSLKCIVIRNYAVI